MQILKKSIGMFFVAFLCAVNAFMSFLIEPTYGSSATMWTEYEQEEKIDMIFVGSSLCSASFDPKVFNEKLGVRAFNMGTPMQPLEQNISAVETAFEEHEIDTVIIALGFFVLQEEPFEEAEVTFEKALARHQGGLKGIKKGLEYCFSEDVLQTEKSINYWFPWVYNKEGYSFDIMAKNVNTKMRVASERREKGQETQAVSQKGYRPYEGYVDYENAWINNSYNTYQQQLREESLQKLEEMLRVCKENGADVLVINTPHPDFDILSCYEMYGENTRIVSDLCEKYEIDYYDFSLAKQEIFDDKEEYYYDYEHLNLEGSQAFCSQLCDLLQQRAAGVDMKNYFYSVEEYLEIKLEKGQG